MDKKEQKIFTRHKIKLPKLNLGRIKQNRKAKKLIKIFIVLLIAVIVMKCAIDGIMPIIDEQCKNMAKSIATKISNAEATRVMADYKYEDFFEVVKDDENNIKMINANMITINKVISDIPILIQEEIEKEENSTFTLKLRKLYRKQVLFWNGAWHRNENADWRERWNRPKVGV